MQIDGLQRSKEELQDKAKHELETTKTGTKFLSGTNSNNEQSQAPGRK